MCKQEPVGNSKSIIWTADLQKQMLEREFLRMCKRKDAIKNLFKNSQRIKVKTNKNPKQNTKVN